VRSDGQRTGGGKRRARAVACPTSVVDADLVGLCARRRLPCERRRVVGGQRGRRQARRALAGKLRETRRESVSCTELLVSLVWPEPSAFIT